MVTTSQLKQLEALNDKNENYLNVPSKPKADLFSLEWLIKQEFNGNDATDSANVTEVNLRNKRLELLFQSVESEQEQTLPTEKHQIAVITKNLANETSINFPTLVLKPHDLTNELEIDLMESSLFSKRSNTQFNDTNSVEQKSHDLTRSHTKSNSIVDDSLRSQGSVNSIPPRGKSLEEISHNINQGFSPNKSSRVSDEPPPRHTNLKPLKRFKSVSSCDLVFPNLNFKKPKR
ncbi:unnamed protein product [Candida parapsilosis]|uniref:Uncharacterized protein n=1 Tax=Candida parapsilosis (strain CDC 317 / ATCC MYA-4646) TaxID=578454 RepID=G8B8C5_CANPC|nr:uncharacterized protein CPAR2_107450 [Candida parapsilosis]CCE40710.1 hypothetical protein CPAR2_107450 [Candida parapsilosis]